MILLIISSLCFALSLHFTDRFDVVINVLIWIPLFIHIICRSYELPNDNYTGKGVYIVFKRPCTMEDFINSLFFTPVSSVSVVVDKDWYGFTLGTKFHHEPYLSNSRHGLIRVNIDPLRARTIMKDAIGEGWRLNNNCCHLAQRLFQYEFSNLDALPGRLALTIIKINKRRDRDES